MTKENLRIIYMGTPDFAVESLRALVEGGYNVIAVVTMPDKPIGRHGSVLQPSPVKQYALEHNLKVMQPEKLKDPVFIEELRALKADLQIVVAFRMLPEVVWSMPPLGTFNAHASLLPKYRGAAPINWAVINGETETGITTFFLKHEIDTGDIIQQVRIPIEESDNVEMVHDKLMVLSGKLVTETVDNIIAGTVTSIPQDQFKDVPLTPAPKIFRDTCRIDWNQLTKRIYDFIRGLSPYPAAWTTLEGKSVKIYEVEKDVTTTQSKPGTIATDGKNNLKVATADGWIIIKTLQLEGKKRMPVSDLLRGLKIKENAFFL
ncbi:MAG: methionyl-tRNA formyltransferase [Bacteroidaceae bacterium]|nr:methionyl-tRNA formyltransferase [Bacteroidaceae bacterium]